MIYVKTSPVLHLTEVMHIDRYGPVSSAEAGYCCVGMILSVGGLCVCNIGSLSSHLAH